MANESFSCERLMDMVDKFISIPSYSHMFYFFSERFVKNNPEYFYEKDGKVYAAWDNTEIKQLPTAFIDESDQEYTVYVVAVEDMKPIKIAYEGNNKNEI